MSNFAHFSLNASFVTCLICKPRAKKFAPYFDFGDINQKQAQKNELAFKDDKIIYFDC
jgi:hypothetical protein